MIYKVETPGRFYDCGEDSAVYFDVRSGDTHLVSVFASHIIELLSHQAMDMDSLRERLSPSMPAEYRNELSEMLPGILDELVSLDIVAQD